MGRAGGRRERADRRDAGGIIEVQAFSTGKRSRLEFLPVRQSRGERNRRWEG
jgi:hypothetical protein